MESIGTRLLREREAQGLSLEEVADRTRINLQYLRAIEQDDATQLPGGFFYRSFVRQYATTLGMADNFAEVELVGMIREEEVVEREKASLPKSQTFHVAPVPMEGVPKAAETKKWMLGFATLASVLVLCSIAYALWERYGKHGVDETKPPVAERPAAPKPGPEPSAVSTTPPDSSRTSPIGATDTTPGSTPTPVPAAAQTQSTPAPPPPLAASASGGTVRLLVRAKGNLWVQVTSGSQRLFAGVIPTGNTREFTSQQPIRVKFGNAGLAEVEHNGSQIPAVGGRGMVRTLEFSADGYEVAEGTQ